MSTICTIAELESKYASLGRLRVAVWDQLIAAKKKQAGIIPGTTIISTKDGKRYLVSKVSMNEYDMRIVPHGRLTRKNGTLGDRVSPIYSYQDWKVESDAAVSHA